MKYIFTLQRSVGVADCLLQFVPDSFSSSLYPLLYCSFEPVMWLTILILPIQPTYTKFHITMFEHK